MTDHFEFLILLARPAAGKSEVIHYLKNLPAEERLERFHIGNMHELDDFPMLWTWFEDDDLLQCMGHPRLHTNVDGYYRTLPVEFAHPADWFGLPEIAAGSTEPASEAYPPC
jgi:hypothetical protein